MKSRKTRRWTIKKYVDKERMNYKERDWVADELQSAMIDLSFERKKLKGNFPQINFELSRICDLIRILRDKRHKLEYNKAFPERKIFIG